MSSIEESDRRNSFSFEPGLSNDKMKLRSAVTASLAPMRLSGFGSTIEMSVSESSPSSSSSSSS